MTYATLPPPVACGPRSSEVLHPHEAREIQGSFVPFAPDSTGVDADEQAAGVRAPYPGTAGNPCIPQSSKERPSLCPLACLVWSSLNWRGFGPVSF